MSLISNISKKVNFILTNLTYKLCITVVRQDKIGKYFHYLTFKGYKTKWQAEDIIVCFPFLYM